MAINAVSLDILAQLARKLDRPCRMLSLGYPDMLVTEAHLARFCGEQALASITFRDDSEAILRWHRLEGQVARVAETRSVLATLGIESDFIDLVASRGYEKVVDLNHPAPPELTGYDIVYDGGTLEHCFNVGQVMRNILGFARVGGYIVHVNPLNIYNHGFFNFNPTFYHDWYGASGNALASPVYAMHGPVLDPTVEKVEAVANFRNAPERTVLVVTAVKRSDAQPAWPLQAKYAASPDLKR